ncbi:MAG TPA: biosynthetic peptidoglycan transglycosylase [Polyangiaceae bacterium]|nr:biosynthetic peptidoglycan transglycosylase [Polyangiaceae bacterium]
MDQGSAEESKFFLRHRVALAACSLVLALALASWVALPALVRSKVRQRALQAQLSIQVDSVTLGWGKIWLHGVTISAPEIPNASLKLNTVSVSPTLGGGVRAVHASGGAIEIAESIDALVQSWRKWRSHANSESSHSSEPGPELEVDGLHLQWHDPLGQGSLATLWGVRAHRIADNETAGFDLAQAQAPSFALRAEGLHLNWRRQPNARMLESLKLDGLSTNLDLQQLPSLIARLKSDGSGNHSGSGSSAAAQALPAAAPLSLAFLGDLRARLAARLREGWAENATVQMPRVQTQLRIGDQVLNIGPGRVTALRDKDVFKLSFAPGAQAAQQTLAFDADLPLGKGDARVSLAGGPIGLDALGVQEGNLGLQGVHDIRLSANGVVTLPDSGAALDVTAQGALENLSFLQPRLAQDVVKADRIRWALKAGWHPDTRLLELSQASFELGEIKSALHGTVHLDADNPSSKLAFEIPLVSCQALFDSVPGSLLPLLKGTRFSGTFSLSAAMELEATRLRDMRFDWTLKNDCRITAVRPDIAPDRFRQPFTYPVYDSYGLPLVRESGPLSSDWTPFDAISPYLETAAIICEDSRFFAHHGIDEKAIESAIVDNVRAGHVVRGASTISMQLAKNLYLNHEKTLSRKLQEAVLTVLLEQELNKQQILELYFNVIEFGPDIWGIRAAADYYFGVKPSDLSLGQALYLVSLLPNPKDHHAKPDGSLSPRWADYLRKLMGIAHKIKRITDDELTKGLAETVTPLFGKAPPPASEAGPEPSADEPPEPSAQQPDDQALPESIPP